MSFLKKSCCLQVYISRYSNRRDNTCWVCFQRRPQFWVWVWSLVVLKIKCRNQQTFVSVSCVGDHEGSWDRNQVFDLNMFLISGWVTYKHVLIMLVKENRTQISVFVFICLCWRMFDGVFMCFSLFFSMCFTEFSHREKQFGSPKYTILHFPFRASVV